MARLIKGAIRHPGELTSYAEGVGCIDRRGHIRDSCVKHHLDRMPKSERHTHLIRAYNLYHNVLSPAARAERRP